MPAGKAGQKLARFWVMWSTRYKLLLDYQSYRPVSMAGQAGLRMNMQTCNA